ncbi:MAG TPA: 5-(carboxyamino)imidazole ribonucleotide mutase [Candidatus Thermoplasmatota archaeon]|nr:5-(carboxyamino)imidazole ribonucleotide mutase [Candidatus Thermoplasmatota archaeon]
MSVQILLGSISDREVAASAEKVLKELDVPFQTTVASAHRSPARVEEIVRTSKADVFIAIAGLTNALAGVVGALTTKPVIGVPVSGKVNLDAILSVVQLPPGMPVAAVGLDRGDNAAHLAAQMIALRDTKLADRLKAYKKKLADKVADDAKKLEANVP